MPDIRAIVNFALAQQGKKYSRNSDKRFGMDYFDCSGLVARSCWENGLKPAGIEWFTGGILQWGLNHGLRMEPDQGIRTYGALLIRGGLKGYGNLGHVAFSLGHGKTRKPWAPTMDAVSPTPQTGRNPGATRS